MAKAFFLFKLNILIVKFLNFLKKPYPFNDDLKHNAKIIFFISIGVLAFLIVFQPIEIKSFTKKELFYLISALAASTFLVLTLNLIILPSLFPKIFTSNKWDIKKEVLWNIWILLTISSCNLLFYTRIFGLMDVRFHEILKILLIGFLPVVALITINQDRLLRSHLKSAQELNLRLISSREKKGILLHFGSEYKNDEITINSLSLILIKSADNYIELFYKRGNELKKHIIRSTLRKAEETVSQIDYVFRCHRSYLINIKHTKEIQGNSQGYKLFMEGLDFPVYVSQRYIPEFQKRIV